jgi:predicted small metal-binding protein
MAKRFECHNVVPGCPGVVEAETEDRVLAAAADHAATVHGMTTLPAPVVEQVRAGITEI